MNTGRPKATLLLENARQLLRFRQDGEGFGRQEYVLEVISGGWCAISSGKIVAVGSREEVMERITTTSETNILDCSSVVVSPGLIDSHTHPVFAVTREKEFEMRILGKSYEEIAAAGGGIRNSVRALRQMDKASLKERVRGRLDRFLEMGTTTIEAKSGYGLSFEDEVKSLEVLRELNEEHPLEIHPTFLGAHEVPDEYRSDRKKYIEIVKEEMIPYVSENHLAEFCDVFCERGVYSIEETREILTAARGAGLKIKLHADQLHRTGATELAIEFGALSADHLEMLDESGCQMLANSETVAGLLPGAVFFLGSYHYPPARRLLDMGATVALATDFNPGSSMTQSLPLMMTLGCLFMKLTPAEAWMAATIGAAKAIGREKQVGNLQEGYLADLVLWQAEDYRQVPYFYGVNLVDTVIKKGEIVYSRNGT